MPLNLNSAELRVVGCLVEKDLSTPEYYPLSLHALVNACNQKSNRDPVVTYDDGLVAGVLDGLRDAGLASFVQEAGSRVEKYRHRLTERFNFTRGEFAVLAELMLRGPQTAGELRSRCERMHHFDDAELVEHTLRKLAGREEEPLVVQLRVQPGRKEPRWAHLVGSEGVEALMAGDTASVPVARMDRLEQLEGEVRALRAEVGDLRAMVERLRPLLE